MCVRVFCLLIIMKGESQRRIGSDGGLSAAPHTVAQRMRPTIVSAEKKMAEYERKGA